MRGLALDQDMARHPGSPVDSHGAVLLRMDALDLEAAAAAATLIVRLADPPLTAVAQAVHLVPLGSKRRVNN
jgi:hypothetical protein